MPNASSSPGKFARCKPILLFAPTWRRHIHVTLDAFNPVAKEADTGRRANHTNTYFAYFLCLGVRTVEKKAIFRVRRCLIERELQKWLIEVQRLQRNF